MTTRPFAVSAALTGIAMAYTNRALIADAVLPRVPVRSESFIYHVLPVVQGLTVPDTEVGRTGRVNRVSFGLEQRSGTVKDYGLEDPIPNTDIQSAEEQRALGGTYDPKATAATNLTDLIALKRELRVAGKVFNPASYDPANRLTLSGNSLFDNAAADPLEVLLDAIAKPIMRPNTLVLGERTWNRMRRNPNLVKAVNGTTGDRGAISRQQLAELLELEAERIIVGRAIHNVARPGQDAEISNCWGPHLALLHLDGLAAANGQRITFGMTFQLGTKIAGEMPDPNVGILGGVSVRVGERVLEEVTAPGAGFFIENAVSAA